MAKSTKKPSTPNTNAAKKKTSKSTSAARSTSKAETTAAVSSTAARAPLPDFVPTSNLVVIPDHPVTEESLIEEAMAMRTVKATGSTIAEIKADADEMLGARADLHDMQARGYRVSENMFDRVEKLRNMLTPQRLAAAVIVAASAASVTEAEASRRRLLEIRGEFAAIGKAAALSSDLFELGTRTSNRLTTVVDRMEDVVDAVRKYRDLMPDPQRVSELLAEAESLLRAERDKRIGAKETRAERSARTKLRNRLQRMLLDALQYLSAQGLAAYANDPPRAARFRLDHIYGDRPRPATPPATNTTTPANDTTTPANDTPSEQNA